MKLKLDAFLAIKEVLSLPRSRDLGRHATFRDDPNYVCAGDLAFTRIRFH